MAKFVRWKWKGKEAAQQVNKQVEQAYNDWGALIVADAKAQLYPGHGYLTGALHDSLYYEVRNAESRIVMIVGSPLKYAIWVHQGHHLRNGDWWEGYHFITNAYEQRAADLPALLAKYKAQP